MGAAYKRLALMCCYIISYLVQREGGNRTERVTSGDKDHSINNGKMKTNIAKYQSLRSWNLNDIMWTIAVAGVLACTILMIYLTMRRKPFLVGCVGKHSSSRPTNNSFTSITSLSSSYGLGINGTQRS